MERKIINVNNEEYYNDSWMYMILISTIAILGESLKNYYFSINGISLTYTIFILPIIIFLINYITKKNNFQTSIATIFLSTVAVIVFTIVINFCLGKTNSLVAIGGELTGYVCSQFIGLTIYLFLLNNTKSPAILVWLNYLFTLIIFYMIYTLINLNDLVKDTYWISYFTTLGIQAIECAILTFFDKGTIVKKRRQRLLKNDKS